MGNPENTNCDSCPDKKSYKDRPESELGDHTGITQTWVPPHLSGENVAEHPGSNPFHYGPAVTLTRPELVDENVQSSNYAKATADAVASGQDESGVTEKSFDREDHKRHKNRGLMNDVEEEEEEGEGDEKAPKRSQSPGVGNSKLPGREHGFTSAWDYSEFALLRLVWDCDMGGGCFAFGDVAY